MVSIIILVQDRFDLVKRCIDSILDNTRTDFELVLIVQAVKDPRIMEYINHLVCKKTVVYNDKNTGVTPGRNQGIDLAIGDYLLFFDDDAYVTTDHYDLLLDYEKFAGFDWLARMLYYFTSIENVGVVSQSGSYIVTDRPGVFWECKTKGAECDVGQGYCFMFSRAVVNKSGKLDPYFGKFWHEESEYALRAKNDGFKVINAGFIGVIHYGSGSGDDGTYGDKINYMFRKWKPVFDRILVPRKDWK